VKPQKPDLVARAVRPDYALGSHVAALGLDFARNGGFGGVHQKLLDTLKH
jgi:glucose/arabinose dehydrogenase